MGINVDPEYEVISQGTLAALNATVIFEGGNSQLECVHILGTWSGTIVFEATLDGTNWFSVPAVNIATNLKVASTTANGVFLLMTAATAKSRVKASAWSFGTANISNLGSDISSVVLALQSDVWNTVLRNSSGTEIGTIANPIQTAPASVVSSLNSTNTPLNAGQTWTGTWEDVIGYSTITLTIFTSHASATEGLKFQTSSDGTNWDDGDLFTMPAMTAGNAKVYSFGVTARYFRIIYINGASNQTAFRLQTILHRVAIKPSSHRVDDSITDEDDAELTKSVLTGKSAISGGYKNVATDDDGRILISGQSELLSPLPSIKIVDRRVIAAGGAYAFTQTISQDTAIKQFTYGGRGPGEGMFGKYVASDQTYVPGGQFNSSGDVAMWAWTGTEVPLGGTPLYSTTQAFEGTGSVQLQFDDSDVNHTVEISYTYPTAFNADAWRYVNAKFYNNVPAGGAVTRTISIVLTDTANNQRLYSVSGLTNAAPFNANGWIDVTGEIRIPSSQVGSTFDINNVSKISLRLVDSGNKAGTVYWDAVKFLGSLDIIQKIYTNGNTIPLNFDPIVPFTAGEIMYLAHRNNDTVAREYQITVGGVDIT
jgi:hypothetical protein